MSFSDECTFLEDFSPPARPKKKNEPPRIIRHIADLSRNGDYSVELNIVHFFDYPPNYDVRRWFRRKNGFVRASKRGIQLTKEETIALRDALMEEFLNDR